MGVISSIFASTKHDINDPNQWVVDWFGGPSTASGERVTPSRALSLPVYLACVRVIAEDVAKLPLITYRRRKDRGKDRVRDHPIYPLLHDSPNREMCAMAFRETLTAHALGWHGGFAEIVRDGTGLAREMFPIHPSRVTLKRNDQGVLFYEVKSDDIAGIALAEPVKFSIENILHIHGLGDDGTQGWPLARVGKETIGRGLAIQRFGASFFGSGSNPSGVVEMAQALKPEQVVQLRDTWAKQYGGERGENRPIVLHGGMTWKQVSVDPEKAQAIQAAGFSVEDICRLHRVNPHKVQHLVSATFNNVEQLSIDHVTDTLMPWLVRWEQEIKRKLFNRAQDADVFAEHFVTGLLRGDQAARGDFYTKRFQMGTMSPNDIREAEGENPIDNGDAYFIAANNMLPLDQAVSGSASTTQPVKSAVASVDAVKKSYMRVFVDALTRVATKETKALTRAYAKYVDNEIAYTTWAERFYSEHAQTIQDALISPAEAMAEILGGGTLTAHVQGEIAALVVDFAARATTIPALDVVGLWIDGATDRIPDQALELTDRIAEVCDEQ